MKPGVLAALLFAAALAHAAGDLLLPIPPILQDEDPRPGRAALALEARTGTVELVAGKPTASLGYNGPILGPTIRVRRGDSVRVAVRNGLAEDTTIHWHGLHVPAEMDGGPHQVIGVGQTWRPEFVIDQEAATLWYHPHLLDKTAEQAYRGLGGFFLIDDEVSDRLPLPRSYGVDDIPVILQDRRIGDDGQLRYGPAGPDVMHGYLGNVMLANGAVSPVLQAPAGVLRLRLLNGSSSSVYRLTLSDGTRMHQVASDGGFLERPVELEAVVLSPGERAEVLVDLRGRATGRALSLEAELFQGGRLRALSIVASRPAATALSIPAALAPVERLDPARSERVRPFVLSTMGPGGQLTINGRHIDMHRVDETVRLGATEIWEVSNRAMGMMQIPHSFHMHNVQFQVLSLNGAPPPATLAGRKDTVLLWPGDTMRLIVAFEDYTGVYMYHCHLLEHEDFGMMGQYEVADQGVARPTHAEPDHLAPQATPTRTP